MKHLSLKLAFVLTVGLVTCWAIADEEIDNPEYGNWSSFGVGASATLKMTHTGAGAEMTMLMTSTLKSMDATKAVVTMVTTMTVNGQDIEQPAMDRDVLARIPKVDPPDDAPETEVEESEETITVEAGTFDCKVVKTTMDMQGQSIVTTIWMCDEVPGGQVKMVSEMGGEVMSTMELVEFDAGA